MPEKKMTHVLREAAARKKPLVAPLVGFPGLALTDGTIKLAQQNYGEHFRALRAIADRFAPDLVFPMMDLSVEANALGRYTVFPREESATVADTRDALRSEIGRALDTCDVLLLSGGVSMGDYDFVGDILAESGCEMLFDRVAIQPGKPLTFGRAGDAKRTLVFGLPGNPVSTYVDFVVFARPALRLLMAAAEPHPRPIRARLAEPVSRRPGRRAYLPARLDLSGDEPLVSLIPSMGSADMVALSRADSLAILDEEASRLEAGVRVPVLVLPGGSG